MENSSNNHYAGPRARKLSDGSKWVAEAFALFKKDVSTWMVTMVLGVMLLLAMSLVPFVGSVASMLLTYVWVGGLMLGCQQVYEGKSFEIGHLFAGFKHQFIALMQLSAFMGLASLLIFAITIGPDYMAILENQSQLNTPEMEALMHTFLFKFLIALLLLTPFFMAAWFAPALIVLHDMSVLSAMRASMQGCLKNVLPFLLYGVLIAVLYIAAIIPFFLGLLVVMPVIIASMYTAYRDIYLDNKTEHTMQLEA